jgi:hypothetical protein
MKPRSFSVPDGGRLEVHGPLEARRMIVIVGRDTFFEDEALVASLIAYFLGRGVAVAHYESGEAVTRRRINPHLIRPWPRPLHLAAKLLLLLAQPTRWRHLSLRRMQVVYSLPKRARTLARALRFLGRDREIFVFARSAGGRLASLVADEAGVRRLACIGYPFQNPEEGPNPDRYAHLPDVRTPFLIIQGTRDEYGGSEIVGKYPLSPHTRLEWVDADHDFRVPDAEWTRVRERIHEFFFAEAR